MKTKEQLLATYQKMVISRAAMVMIIAAPAPAAITKLQGTYLDAQMISVIIILCSAFSMASLYLNRIGSGFLFVVGNTINVIATGGLVGMFYMDVDIHIIVVWFPVMSSLGFILVGVASTQIKNKIKDAYGKEFDLSIYENKKTAYISAAMIIGQGLAVVFYTLSDVTPLSVLVVIETINTVLYSGLELQRWRIVKEMGILDEVVVDVIA